jgi:hypothetical protein
VLGEPAFALLREDHVPVGDDVELAFLTGDCGGFVRGALVQLGCETRSPAVVAVSDGAVEDLDLHSTEPSEARGRRLEIPAGALSLDHGGVHHQRDRLLQSGVLDRFEDKDGPNVLEEAP